MLMQYTTSDRLTLGLWHVVGMTAGDNARVERQKHQTAVNKQSLMGAAREYWVTQEIARIAARNATRIDLSKG